MHTRATNIYEVQKVKTFANMLETLGGSFTLGFDTTATGGGAYITAQIPNAALPTRGTLCHTSASALRLRGARGRGLWSQLHQT